MDIQASNNNRVFLLMQSLGQPSETLVFKTQRTSEHNWNKVDVNVAKEELMPKLRLHCISHSHGHMRKLKPSNCYSNRPAHPPAAWLMCTALFLSLNLQIAYIAAADPVPLAAAAAAINHSSGEWPNPGTADWAKSSGPPAEALAIVAYTFYIGGHRACRSNCVS